MEEKKENNDDVLVDFSTLSVKIKNLKHKFFKKSTAPDAERNHQKQEKSEESIEFKKSFRETSFWLKKNSKWLLPFLCILIAVFASVYLRTMPLRMPITDVWAENAVHNFYQNQLQQQLAQKDSSAPKSVNTRSTAGS